MPSPHAPSGDNNPDARGGPGKQDTGPFKVMTKTPFNVGTWDPTMPGVQYGGFPPSAPDPLDLMPGGTTEGSRYGSIKRVMRRQSRPTRITPTEG